MMRLFNAIPGEIRDITGVKTEVFNRELDRWLKGAPDQTEIDEYRAQTNSNSIIHHASQPEIWGNEKILNVTLPRVAELTKTIEK